MKMGRQTPVVRFLRSTPAGPIPADASFLDSAVPLGRPGGSDGPAGFLTYRDYLLALEKTVMANLGRFAQAISDRTGGAPPERTAIDIIAEKHGSDYHPARVRLVTPLSEASFVVNVALTDRGRQRLQLEFPVLKRLNDEFRLRYIPRVYFEAALTPACGEPAAMFVGEWLDGYHEFHVSRQAGFDPAGANLWDMGRGYTPIPVSDAREAFRQAAFILTYYYDAGTFREIYPWHHAAGDFVMKYSGDGIDLRLIAARQYAPRIVFPEYSPDNCAAGLVLFFLNLTIRMRLDRFDGIGEIAWISGHCVEGAFDGFTDALGTQIAEGRLSPLDKDAFGAMAKSLSPAQLAELFSDVVSSYDENAAEVPAIVENLPEHVFQVYGILNSGRL